MTSGLRLSSIVPKLGVLLGLLAGLSTAEPLRADEAVDPEALFRDGKRDLEEGRLEAACSKFASSYEASGVAGALLSWADCEEQRGHLRLAHELFSKGVIAVAGDAERRSFARERAEGLVARLPRLQLEIAAQPRAVTVDGEAVRPTQPLTLDPGEHLVRAEWSGGAYAEQRITLVAGQSASVRLEPPTAPPTPRRTPTPDQDSRDDRTTLLTAGWIVGASGLAAALSFAGTAVAVAVECPDQQCAPSMEGVLIGNAVTGAIGGAGLAAGALLLGLGYAERDTPVVAFGAGPGELGFSGRLRF